MQKKKKKKTEQRKMNDQDLKRTRYLFKMASM